MDLRDAVSSAINAETTTDTHIVRSRRLRMADRILAIPEIANGLQLLEMRKDEMIHGTGCVRITRISPEDVRIDAPV